MSEESEQNKTEEATPFKLRKAREQGQVARGSDLGFLGSLIALAVVAVFAGRSFFAGMADAVRHTLSGGVRSGADPYEAVGMVAGSYWQPFQAIVILGVAVMVVLVTLELIQLRGFIFTTKPLKPDFKRLDPAKGLKRLFSMRMLKETLKNVVKFACYASAAWFVARGAIESEGIALVDAGRLALAMEESGLRLLFVFIGIAFVFMVIDQVIVRGEFRKQMRMSRSELTRETKDREGEPRFKQKRKEIHQEMREQSESLERVGGSDLVVVNPEHYAIALRYDARAMDAPLVQARGRDHFAQAMKRKARLHNVPIVHNPPLARALHAECRVLGPIRQQHYRDVAQLYRELGRTRQETAQ